MSKTLQFIVLSVLTLLTFVMDGLFALNQGKGDPEARVPVKQLLSMFKILFSLTWILFSGWYLSAGLGAVSSLLIFLLTILGVSYTVYQMYELPSLRTAFFVTLGVVFGYPFPAIKVSGGLVDQKFRGTPAAKLGGPGLLQVAPDTAALIRKGKETRVVGVGIHVLKRGEKVQETVDLRPQLRTGSVTAMTKDGFEITVDYVCGFQIDTGGRESTHEKPWPFSEEAVRKAIFKSKQVTPTGAQQWHERVPGALFGSVREMIATHYLEDFFEPDDPDSKPREALKAWLKENTLGAAEGVGAQLNWVNFATPKIPNEATRELFEKWCTQKWSTGVKVEDMRVEVGHMEGLVRALKEQDMSENVIMTILARIYGPKIVWPGNI